MRNLKRALSLTLASVMLLGMMVVGASAAGFPDVEDTHNVEAIEVLKAVDVMVGDDKGNFGPDQQVSRAQMAVVMAKLLNLDYNYYQGQCKFTDVPNWAAPYVAACYANGIVSGYNDTTYGANDDVTAVQAASMMMRALGYFKYKEDYQPTFELATVKQASEIGIFSQVNADAKTPLTRNQVAQMALNALRTNMVTFTGTPGITVDNVTVGYKAEYTPRTSPEAKYNAITNLVSDIANTNQYYIQLGEQLYDGDLRLNDNAIDVFGRPSRYWEYDGKEIGTYAKDELVRQEWTEEVTGRMFYDLLGSSVIDDKSWDINITIDGETSSAVNSKLFNRTQMNKNNKAGVGDTGNGVLTQVFVDTNKKVVDIAIINTFLARAKADYNEKRDEVSFNVYGIKKTGDDYIKVDGTRSDNKDTKESIPVSGEDFLVKDVQENDTFLVTVADGEIQTLRSAEVISAATLTSFKKDSNVVANGETYKFADAAEYDFEVLENYTSSSSGATNLKDREYNVYLDAYGYLLGINLVESADNYVFITGIDSATSNLSASNYKAGAIFLDGTMKTITFKTKGSSIVVSDPSLANTWCTYTVDSNDIYTLKQVKGNNNDGTSPIDVDNGVKLAQSRDTASTQIDVKHVSLNGATAGEYKKVYGNNDTVYINAEVKTINADYKGRNTGIISDVNSTSTGVKNASYEVYAEAAAKLEADKNAGVAVGTAVEAAYGTYVLYKSNGYVVAAVTVAEDGEASKNLVYVTSGGVTRESYDKATDKWTWSREVVYNGELIELLEVGDSLEYLDDMQKYNWYQVRLNANNEVIKTPVLAHTALKHDAEYTDLTSKIETAINAKTTVLFEASKFQGITNEGAHVDGAGCNTEITTNGSHDKSLTASSTKPPYLRGNTFYVDTTDVTESRGFFVDDNVKVVFIQKNDNKETISYESGVDGLEDMVDDLNLNSSNQYKYEVSAIIESGMAKVVVIRDLVGTGNAGKPNEDTEGLVVDITNPAAVTVTYTGTAPTDEEAIAAIIKEIESESNGFTVEEVKLSSDGSKYEFHSTKMINGRKTTIVYLWNKTATEDYEITLTGEGTYRIPKNGLSDWDSVISAINSAYSKSFSIGDYVKVGDNYYAKSANDGVKNGATVDIGYYKVTVGASITNAANDTNGGGATLTAATNPADFYAKKVAGNYVTVPVVVTTTDATKNTGLKFAVSGITGAEIISGGIIGGGTNQALAGKYTVNVKVSCDKLVTGANTLTLTVAAAPSYIKIFVNGAEQEVEVGKKVSEVITGIPEDANSFVLVGSSKGAAPSGVKAGNSTFAASDANKDFGNVEYVTYTAPTVTDTSNLFDVASFSGTQEVKAIGGDSYVKVGDTVKVVLTAKATVNVTLASFGTKMSVASSVAGDTVVYDGTKNWTSTTNTSECQETADAGGVDLILKDETVTVTLTAKPTSATAFVPTSTITVTPAAA